MTTVAEELEQIWYQHLFADNPQASKTQHQSIVKWLLGENPDRFDTLNPTQLEIVSKGIDYRYRILQKRYLSLNPTRAYRNLLNRLGSVITIRNKVRTWVALSRDRQRAVADVLQEVIQEMLNSDRYIHSQVQWISQCTQDERLKQSLLLAAIEEYCLRPIRNQPLLAYRFVNFLRRQSRGGMTQVPQQEMIRLLSEEVGMDEDSSTISLLDNQAINQYQQAQDWEEKQALRLKVKEEFEEYLSNKLGPEAVEWFKLYLSGRSQEAIAKRLNLPIKQVYRLREKVSYHAIRVFALKGQPELVANWLEISIQEHNLGLTPKQWQTYWQELNPTQQQIINELKAGKSLEAIGQELNWKKSQIMGEWSQMYLAAQTLRSEGAN
jgi:DNA-binding CsgD family transcriptional regulator